MSATCSGRGCVVSRSFCFRRPETWQCRATRAAFEGLVNRRACGLIADRRGVVLADDVGMGKTFEALATTALFWKRQTQGRLHRSFRILLVVPNHQLTRHWQCQVLKLLKNCTILDSTLQEFLNCLYRAMMEERVGFSRRANGLEVAVYTRHQFWRGSRQPHNNRPPVVSPRSFGGRRLDLIIVDEAHHLRSGGALAANLATLIENQVDRDRLRVLFLTATPFQIDHVDELVRVLSFLDRAHRPNRIPALSDTPANNRTLSDPHFVYSACDLDTMTQNDQEAGWLYEVPSANKREHLGAASAIESVCLGLHTLRNGFENIMRLGLTGAKRRAELASVFTSLDRDIDKVLGTRGRTSHRTPLRLSHARAARDAWHVELSPAPAKECKRWAKHDAPGGRLPVFVADEAWEEGLDNYLRDFIIRNRRLAPPADTSHLVPVWNSEATARYLDNRHNLIEPVREEEPGISQMTDPERQGYWHNRYLRLASSNCAARRSDQEGSPPHLKITWLLDVLLDLGVFLNDEAQRQAAMDYHRSSRGVSLHPVRRKKAVVFFESLDSIRAVKSACRGVFDREFQAVTGIKGLRGRDPIWRRLDTEYKKSWRTMVEDMTGSTPTHQRHRGRRRRTRDEIQEAFNRNGPPYLLLCSRVGFEGIDLDKACDVAIHHDLHWNPTVLDQRTGRVFRGKKRPQRIRNIALRLPHIYDMKIHDVAEERRRFKDFILGESALSEFLADE